ncbi:MAG: phytanoyl-CoA dioxygenase family protein [Ilumatobacteraceae bacterium]
MVLRPIVLPARSTSATSLRPTVSMTPINRLHEVLILRRVRSRVDKGRWREAIDTLARAARRHPSPRLLEALVNLRHEAFWGMNFPASGVRTWPRECPDLHSGHGVIPEIRPRELSVDQLCSGVLHHGSLIVRGLLPKDNVESLRRCVDLAYDGHDRFAHGSNETSPAYRPFVPVEKEGVDTAIDRTWFRGSGAELAADSPIGLANLLESFDAVGLTRVITEYLGESPALSVRKTSLRRVAHDQTETGWHQDGAFLGTGIRTLNVWIALSDCGVDAPSMEMVPLRLNSIAPTGTPGALMGWTVSPTVVAEYCGDHLPVHLQFKAGDAIFFDEMNLHRTSSRDHFTKPRYAIEAWFFAPSCYPLDQLPLLV